MGRKISAEKRSKTATVHTGGKEKFPVFDAKSARSALKLLNNAKPPLTDAQKAAVRRKAAKYGVTPKEED